jgi:hypothetical protein
MKDAIVWSKAKLETLRYLSNFTHVVGGIRVTMPDGVVCVFPSIEHAFHAHKAFYLVGGTVNAGLAATFAVGGVVGAQEGVACKRAGGRKAFQKAGCALDCVRWEEVKVDIMRRLVIARAEADVRYGTICRDLVVGGYAIRHHVPRGKDDLLLGQRLNELGHALNV